VALGGLLGQLTAPGRGDVIAHVIVVLCAIIGGYTVVLGPQLARQDLRGDLQNADLLKTYPIEGWRLALGELLAPTVLLSLILWSVIFIAAAALGAGEPIEWLGLGRRLTGALCLALLAPLLCLLQLIVPNTIMVVFPSWYQAARSRSGGVEMFGQRMLFGIVQVLFTAGVVVPAAAWAVLVWFCTMGFVGPAGGVILGSFSALAILAAEAAVGLWWLGERFAHFDLSSEPR
jgi:hypothetical protein